MHADPSSAVPDDRGPAGEPRRTRTGDPVYDSMQSLATHGRRWEGVAYLGLLIFVATMSYEYGFAHYWHIPFELVSFTAENAFRVAVALVLSALAVLIGVAMYRGFKFRRVAKTLLAIVVCLSTCMVFRILSEPVLFAAVAGLAFVAISVSFLLVPRSEGMVTHWTIRVRRYMGVAMLTLLLATMYFAAATGFLVATGAQEHLVTDTAPRLVLLRVYGTTAVAAVLDESAEQKQLLPGFRLINLTEANAPTVRRMDLKFLLPAQR
jgi:hypothetical protein